MMDIDALFIISLNVFANQVLASASATVHESNNCRICLWDVNSEVCRRVICHHGHQVTSMTYSSDDRFLLIVGTESVFSLTNNLSALFVEKSAAETPQMSAVFILLRKAVLDSCFMRLLSSVSCIDMDVPGPCVIVCYSA